MSIDDQLLAEARQRAVAEHRSLGDVVDDSLRALFARRPPADRPRTVLPKDGDPAARPLIDIDDREALAEALGDNSWPRADA